MSKIDDFLKQFDAAYNLGTMEPAQLIHLYRQINDKRSAMDKDAKKLKAKEEAIKSAVGQLMKDREQTSSGKTAYGEAHFKTSNSITTKDAPIFIEWLRENPDQLNILGTRPYTQDKMKEMVGYDKDKELPELPPGTEWYREQKVVIKK